MEKEGVSSKSYDCRGCIDKLAWRGVLHTIVSVYICVCEGRGSRCKRRIYCTVADKDLSTRSRSASSPEGIRG